MKIFIYGFGYSAQEVARLAGDHAVSGCVRSVEKARQQQALGHAVFALESPEGNERLQEALATADALIVSAPPEDDGDPLLRMASSAIETSRSLRRMLYWSTLGVYGDHGGAWIDENAPLNAQSPRTLRRVTAEQDWLSLGERSGRPVMIHRLAGIYGPGRSAIEDVADGTARRIHKDGQVFNRIHVSDIAGAALAAMLHPSPPSIVNLCDDQPAPSADVVAHAAALLGVPPPPLEAYPTATMSDMARSFWQDCRRCRNDRLKTQLGYGLRFPDYRSGLADCLSKHI